MRIKQHRALLIAVRKRRKEQKAVRDSAKRLNDVCSQLNSQQRENSRLLEMAPFYIRVRRCEEHRFGRLFNCSLAFNLDALTRCFLEASYEQPYEIDRYIRYAAGDMAQKCANSIREAVAKELGMSDPYSCHAPHASH